VVSSARAERALSGSVWKATRSTGSEEVFGKRDGAWPGNGRVERAEQIRVRIHADQLGGRFCRACRRARRPRCRVSERELLSADDRTAQRAFGRIVIQPNARVLAKARQAGPAFEHVAHGLPDVAAWQANLHRGHCCVTGRKEPGHGRGATPSRSDNRSYVR